ncbi:M20 metallopeptidase family protein [Gudongella sp. SC589]|jgi:amidohydrolase|uniref:M20 metallopeptidase family protein n=1 Tax=Gudongella sp. SC589 TaxID=3385990 RepID=UPI0039048406
MIDKILNLTNEYENDTVELRRKIHQNPELSHVEYQTSRLVAESLSKLDGNLELVGDTGILFTMEGGKAPEPGQKYKTVLLRADMDALPIEEQVESEFKSRNKGIMHACGHDVHTANLVAVARVMSRLRGEWSGIVKFLYQPGEERGAGARRMIEGGVLLDPDVDLALALHVMPMDKGLVHLNQGIITACSDGFTLTIRGKSAHSRKPQQGIDAINIAGHIIVALNSIQGRNLDPFSTATLSVGMVSGGNATNVIADMVQLKGIIRSLDGRSREVIRDQIAKISSGIAKAFGGECECVFKDGYPSVSNSKEAARIVGGLLKDSYNELVSDIDMDSPGETCLEGCVIQDAQPVMAAEDFGFISQRVESLYYKVGTGNYGPGHSPTFDVDERWIKFCTRTMVLACLKLMEVRE